MTGKFNIFVIKGSATPHMSHLAMTNPAHLFTEVNTGFSPFVVDNSLWICRPVEAEKTISRFGIATSGNCKKLSPVGIPVKPIGIPN